MGTGETYTLPYQAGPSSTYWVFSPQGDEYYVFDSNGKHLTTQTVLTNVTKLTFNYNGSNLLTSIVDAYSNTTTFTRNMSGQLTDVVAPFGQSTTITLTGSGLLSTVTNPNSEVYTLTYKTGTALLETFTKPGTQVSTFTYDANGRLTKDQGNGGNYFTLGVSGSSPYPLLVTSKLGRVKSHLITKTSGNYQNVQTLPDGNVYTHWETGTTTHDQDNVKTVEQDTADHNQFGPLLKRTSEVRTTMGGNTRTDTFAQTVAWPGSPADIFDITSLTETATTSGRTQTRVYTASTRKWTYTSHEGATSELVLDVNEKPTSWKVGSDTATTMSYDGYGRMNQITQGSNKTVTIAYNGAGFIQSLTNIRSEVTGFTYDLAGRVTQITLPDSRVITYAYDANGNVTSITSPSSNAHGFVFNAFELLDTYQPTSIGVGVTKDTSYTYNDDKQLTQISRPDSTTVDFTYDSTTGKLTTVTVPAGTYNLVYYSSDKQLWKIKAPTGVRNDFTYYGDKIASDAQTLHSSGFVFGTTSFTYDSSHRLASRSVIGNTGSASTINYTYNNDDMPTTVGAMTLAYSYPSGRLSTTTIGNISDTRTYDSYGDLTGYTATYTPTSTTLYTYTLTRDNAGRISSKTETIGGTTTTYDYVYDSAGRLTDYKVGGTVTTHFNYDSNSNRTSGKIDGTNFTATFDGQDRISTFGTRSYTWNNNGDLTKVQWTAMTATNFTYDQMGNLVQATPPSGTVYDYVSDGLDRRVVRKVGSTVQFRALYEGQYRIAAFINGSGAIGQEFVYATGRNVPDYIKASGTTYRIITDHLGSPRLVVRTSDGVTMQRMDYNVIGVVTADTSPGFQPFGFAGGIYDVPNMLFRFGARDYDPRATGRWTTKDPIRFAGGDTNLYGYVLNDPVNWKDPSGKVLVTVDDTGQQLLSKSLNEVNGTCVGKSVLNSLERSSKIYRIHLVDDFTRLPNFDPDTNTILLRPNGDFNATLTQTLAHELGHAILGGGSEAGANGISNAIRFQLGN